MSSSNKGSKAGALPARTPCHCHHKSEKGRSRGADPGSDKSVVPGQAQGQAKQAVLGLGADQQGPGQGHTGLRLSLQSSSNWDWRPRADLSVAGEGTRVSTRLRLVRAILIRALNICDRPKFTFLPMCKEGQQQEKPTKQKEEGRRLYLAADKQS